MERKVIKRSVLSYIMLFLVIIVVYNLMGILNTKVNKLTYSEFLTELENNKVTELNIKQNSSQGLYYLTGKLEGYNSKETFTTNATLSEETLKQIYEGKKGVCEHITLLYNAMLNSIGIKTLDGEIKILELQFEGKKRTLVKDYLNGVQNKDDLIKKVFK